VVAFDQTREVVYQGRAGDLGPAHLDRIRARAAFGASDLSAALTEAEGTRLMLFTDGVATAGAKRPDELRSAVKALKGVERVDVVMNGGVRDEGTLAQLVTAGLPRHGVVLDADRLEPAEISRRLALGASGSIEVQVPGAEWIWPSTLSGVQPGDSVAIHARIPAAKPLSLKLDGKVATIAAARTMPGPLLDRSAAHAELQRLQHLEARATDPAERNKLAERAVEISTSRRVLSPHTALLVLETEADYERFGIARNGLADILTVREGELTWLARGTPVYGNAPPVDAPRNENRDAPADEFEGEEKSKKASEDREMDEGPSGGESASARSAPAAPAPRPSPSRGDRAGAPPAPPPPPPPAAEPVERERRVSSREEARSDDQGPNDGVVGGQAVADDPLAAWEGRYREVMVALQEGRLAEGERMARAWLAETPGDPLALLALGETLQRKGQLDEAARVYGSLIDLFPSRADLRRLAGERLETLGKAGLPLAIDTYRTAVEQRPDHPSGHRNLAWALAREKRWADAIDVLDKARAQPFERFEAAHRIMSEDAAILGAAWRKAEPNAPVAARLLPFGTEPATKHALRFVLNWETDANDVDFHIYDAKGGHAYYSSRDLPSGGSLYADITSGYGPECFAIDKPSAFPYRLQAHYYSRGPMGFGMGKLQVVEHDGRGGLFIEDRPFVVMTDGAYVPLGEVKRSSVQ
jgi:Flp pilus assembly protein TadD